MSDVAVCGLCQKPIDLTPEHRKLWGTKHWFHKHCADADNERRAHNTPSIGE